MDVRRRHPLVPYVALPILLLAYVLSYAPAFRLACGKESSVLPMGGPFGIYQPVDWAIDSPQLNRALLRWAGICGVDEQFSLANAMRTGDLGIPYRQGSFPQTW